MNSNTSQTKRNNLQHLPRYARNLIEDARNGKLDPVVGRDEEIRRVLQILSRRTKNNPILIGEPGTGKTAIVEGLAQRIVRGDVPDVRESILHSHEVEEDVVPRLMCQHELTLVLVKGRVELAVKVDFRAISGSRVDAAVIGGDKGETQEHFANKGMPFQQLPARVFKTLHHGSLDILNVLLCHRVNHLSWTTHWGVLAQTTPIL